MNSMQKLLSFLIVLTLVIAFGPYFLQSKNKPSPKFKVGDCILLFSDQRLIEKVFAVKDKEYKTAYAQYSTMCQKEESWCFSVKFQYQDEYEKVTCPSQ